MAELPVKQQRRAAHGFDSEGQPNEMLEQTQSQANFATLVSEAGLPTLLHASFATLLKFPIHEI